MFACGGGAVSPVSTKLADDASVAIDGAITSDAAAPVDAEMDAVRNVG
jgi:hypothetical protein